MEKGIQGGEMSRVEGQGQGGVYWNGVCGRYNSVIQMRGVGSKQKLQMMHQALDRQLQQITAQPRSSSTSRRDRDELRYTSNLDDPKRPPMPSAQGKPSTFDHMVRESDIRTKKNEIGELQRKLMELERKMDNVSLESDQDEQEKEKEKEGRNRSSLAFRQQKDPPLHPNEDTARFLLQANREKQKSTNKFLYSYPSLQDEQQEEDENSDEDFAVMQRAIQRKKQQQAGRRTVNTKVAPPQTKTTPTVPQRKISTQAQSVLKPKYSNEKNKPKPVSQQKKSIRDSVTSKRSQEKTIPQQPQHHQLNRANSKRSIKSNHSNNSLRRSRQVSRERQDRSFDRFSQKEQCLHSEQLGLAKDLKKLGNLQKEVAHYKRLAKKYKEQLDEYRVMEIELKELRKNFAKSELIRTQQKKVIQTLKSKIGK